MYYEGFSSHVAIHTVGIAVAGESTSTGSHAVQTAEGAVAGGAGGAPRADEHVARFNDALLAATRELGMGVRIGEAEDGEGDARAAAGARDNDRLGYGIYSVVCRIAKKVISALLAIIYTVTIIITLLRSLACIYIIRFATPPRCSGCWGSWQTRTRSCLRAQTLAQMHGRPPLTHPRPTTSIATDPLGFRYDIH